ncbi:hypothetical protein [Kineococcus sp. SYSU DK005]|uniref:hypothetical protein n=1 Tax=Kineococcus sp. SYSU DK005 TaxID=3383126 RepID=UPI003D7DAD44
MAAPEDAIRAALDGTPAALSGTERAVLGPGSPARVFSLFDARTRDRLGRSISALRFRAGRIDADWCAGNVAVADGELVGAFDREPVADSEAVTAGFSAAGFATSSTSGGGLSTPEEALGFLLDHERARGVPFDGAEQRTAAAAAAWVVAFNARWETAMRPGLDDGATTASLHARGEDLLSLTR